MAISFILYFILVQLSLLVPGYSIIKKSGLMKSSPGIQLCLSYVFALILFGSLASFNYAFNLNPDISRYICWLVLLFGLFLFIKEGHYRSLLELRFPLFCLLITNALSLAFISLNFAAPYKIIPDPQPLLGRNYKVTDVKILNVAQTNANDNYVPYRQAQFFINRSDPSRDSFIGEWGVTFFQRTPLMGAVVANYFNLLSDKPPVGYSWSASAADPDHTFIKFQIIAQVLNGLFIVPGYLILAALFKRKTALITSLFLATSSFFIYNTFFSWPKSLVAFLVLSAWLLLLRRGATAALLAGIVSGVAYLSHDLTSLYVATGITYLLLSKRFRDTLLYILPTALLATPWLWLTSIKYKRTSSFIYYPFSIHGIPQEANKSVIFQRFFDTSPWFIIKIHLKSLFYLLSPYQLITGGGQDLPRRLWSLGLYPIPGALGAGLIVPGYISIVAWFKKTWPVVLFILMPVILFVLATGWSLPDVDSEGALHFAQASVVLWSGLAIAWLLKFKSRVLILAAYLLNGLQFIFFLFYSYKFREIVWVHHVRDVVCLTIIGGVLIVCGWLIYLVISSKKNWLTAGV